MPRYVYLSGDARDYFYLGRVEPGDTRDLDQPPDDGCWAAETTAKPPSTAVQQDAGTDRPPSTLDTAQED